ncbi:hypothetical protein [Paracoccus ravus]|uniref:hypothetical protein n=1 Tax=Paracoccus ravus TaxID=2447760 RepID=UPI00106E9850|nr:hypothetical protein [Paracoccus ravus]
MRELAIVTLVLLGLCGLAYLAPRLILRHRRARWHHVDAVVARAGYEVLGKNAVPMLDVTLPADEGSSRHLGTEGLDPEALHPGDHVNLLVDPRHPERCVLDPSRGAH